jgi:hypothetical protein
LCRSAPGIRAIAVFEEIRRRHPEIATGNRPREQKAVNAEAD